MLSYEMRVPQDNSLFISVSAAVEKNGSGTGDKNRNQILPEGGAILNNLVKKMPGYGNEKHFKQILMAKSIGRYIPERERGASRLVYPRRGGPPVRLPVRGVPPELILARGQKSCHSSVIRVDVQNKGRCIYLENIEPLSGSQTTERVEKGITPSEVNNPDGGWN